MVTIETYKRATMRITRKKAKGFPCKSCTERLATPLSFRQTCQFEVALHVVVPRSALHRTDTVRLITVAGNYRFIEVKVSTALGDLFYEFGNL